MSDKAAAGTRHVPGKVKLTVTVLRFDGKDSSGKPIFVPLELGTLCVKRPHRKGFEGPVVLDKAQAEFEGDGRGLHGEWILQVSGFDVRGGFYEGSMEVLLEPKQPSASYEFTFHLAPE
ncbi:MAG: hypothetical protein IT364_16215 [Candidatus Hydrogenedentes bacterium]|nr:hypothetical protein [Candidatus Hydrogenedentota bacterium]